MFYGRAGGDFSKGGGGGPRRNDRYDQMTRQQELIEQKKREIQARLEAERKKKEMEQLLKKSGGSSSGRGVSSSTSSSTNKSQPSESPDRDRTLAAEDKKPAVNVNNIFNNDGSFLEQFKRMQEQRKKEEEAKKAKEIKIKEEPVDINEYGSEASPAPKKPTIKILNVPPRSFSPAEVSSRNSMAAVPPPSNQNENQSQSSPNSSQVQQTEVKLEEKYYPRMGYQNVPPPPPPPPPPPSGPHQFPVGFPSQVVRQLAKDIAEGGDHIEDMARVENQDDPLMWFLYRPDSAEYKRYRDLVSQLRIEHQGRLLSVPGPQPHAEKRKNETSSSEDEYGGRRDQDSGEYGGRASRPKHRKRRSRWGPESDSNSTSAPETGGPGLFNPMSQSQMQPGPANFDSSAAFVGFSQNSPFNGPPEMQGMPFPPIAPGGMMPMAVPPPGMGPRPSLPMGLGFLPDEFLQGPPPPPPPPPPPGSPPSLGVQPWKMKEEIPGVSNPSVLDFPPVPSTKNAPPLSKVARNNSELLAYAQQAYGTTDLDEEQWKQCEEAYKMNLVFRDIARKKARDEKLMASGKFKHEYDSDEDVDGGTWEHKQRMKEMEKTKTWATDLTSKAKGKHHIGDFLPPEELSKFMDKFKHVKEGKPFDSSDYQEAKITESNVGFKMLQKMGWTDGQGLGTTGQGITAPIDKGNAVSDKQGLGVEKPDDLNEEDDEYSAYRKRMMLAYRFRPNPLNNPRRAYY